jgi:peptidoglycan/LPS O-acetylase OafA/YrhL
MTPYPAKVAPLDTHKIETRRVPLPALTGARFFAALAVVLHHSRMLRPFPRFLDVIALQGRAGVSFFYILSGFILAYNYRDWFRNDLHHWKRFAHARFSRIYPMYFVALLWSSLFVIAARINDPAELKSEVHSALTAFDMARSWILNVLMLQVYSLAPLDQWLWNAAFWSISCEIAFYVAFPFLMWRFNKLILRSRPAAFWFVLAGSVFVVQGLLFIATSRAIRRTWSDHGWLASITLNPIVAFDHIAYRQPVIRVGEFIVGVCLAIAFLEIGRDGVSKRAASACLATGLCGCGITAVLQFFVPRVPIVVDQLQWYVFYVPAFALIIFSLACGRTMGSAILGHPGLVLLGEASYSLYLIHLPILIFLARSKISQPLLIISAIMGVVGLSIICLHVIEIPARRALRRLAPGPFEKLS